MKGIDLRKEVQDFLKKFIAQRTVIFVDMLLYYVLYSSQMMGGALLRTVLRLQLSLRRRDQHAGHASADLALAALYVMLSADQGNGPTWAREQE